MRLASDANRRQDTSFHWSEALQRRNRVNWGKMLGVFSKAGAANRELALLASLAFAVSIDNWPARIVEIGKTECLRVERAVFVEALIFVSMILNVLDHEGALGNDGGTFILHYWRSQALLSW